MDGECTASYNILAAIDLAKQFKAAYPAKDIWAWSGRYIDDIKKLEHGEEFLSAIDTLIDRSFHRELKGHLIEVARKS